MDRHATRFGGFLEEAARVRAWDRRMGRCRRIWRSGSGGRSRRGRKGGVGGDSNADCGVRSAEWETWAVAALEEDVLPGLSSCCGSQSRGPDITGYHWISPDITG